MLLRLGEKINIDLNSISCILVHEVQFLTWTRIDELWKISKINDVAVICYGVKTYFKSKTFEGSKRLIEIADQLDELITFCSGGKRAKFNARKQEGTIKRMISE